MPHASDRQPRVGILVDHPDRDLVTAAMTAAALVRRGCTASVIPLYEQGVDVPLLGLDAILVNFVRPANRKVVERYVALGIDVFVLDTEGGVLAQDGPNAPHRLARTLREEGWSELLAGYFFWGPVLRDAFAQAGALPESRLHLTGCPRFDLVGPQWRPMLDFPQRDYVLVNTAFPLVNSRFTADGEDRDAMILAGWEAGYVDEMLADSREVIARMIALVERMVKAFPERAFLLRPHPFEKEATYAVRLGHLANVTISGRGSALNVIANSACVLQLNCSTAIEALMLDKLPLSPDFISTPRLREHSPLPNRASMQIASEDKLLVCLADLPAAAATFDFAARYRDLAEPYFYHRDGEAADRIASVLGKVDAGDRAPNLHESLRCSHRHPRAGQRIQGMLANVLGSARSSWLRSWFSSRRRGKTLDPHALAALLSAAASVSGEPMPHVARHRHPLTGAALASIMVAPRRELPVPMSKFGNSTR